LLRDAVLCLTVMCNLLQYCYINWLEA